MKQDIFCPFCDAEFEGETWVDSKCPKCEEEYYWDELIADDLSDSWVVVEWEKYRDWGR